MSNAFITKKRTAFDQQRDKHRRVNIINCCDGRDAAHTQPRHAPYMTGGAAEIHKAGSQ